MALTRQSYETIFFEEVQIKKNKFIGLFISKNGIKLTNKKPADLMTAGFYFRLRGLKSFDEDIFEQSYRLQNTDQINISKLRALAERFQQDKLIKIVEAFIKWSQLHD